MSDPRETNEPIAEKAPEKLRAHVPAVYVNAAVRPLEKTMSVGHAGLNAPGARVGGSATAQDKDLEKGKIANAVVAATVGATSLAPSISSESASASLQSAVIEQVKRDNPSPHIELHPELHAISEIESSGGKNKNHALTTVGLNAGHRAAGSTGLMPLTVKETISKSPDLQKKYSHLMTMTHDRVTQHLNENPSAETEIANHHWERITEHFKDNGARRAFAWRNGITAAKRASDSEVMSHPYVQKFLSLTTPKVAMNKSEIKERADLLLKAIRSEIRPLNIKGHLKTLQSRIRKTV